MSKGVGTKIITEKPTETINQANGSSQTLGGQLGGLQGANLGPLHVDDSGVTWSVCGAPRSGSRTCPWHRSWLLGTYYPRRDAST